MASSEIIEWSERILDYVGTGISTVGHISNWLLNNAYRLNSHFGTDYAPSGNSITPTLTTNHSGVLEESFYCSLYQKLAIQNLGVNQFNVRDLTEAEVEGQGRLRFVSRNETAKTLRLQANDCRDNLQKLIDDLNNNANGGMFAGQILFSDRQNMIYGDNYCPPCDYFHKGNTVFSDYYTA